MGVTRLFKHQKEDTQTAVTILHSHWTTKSENTGGYN